MANQAKSWEHTCQSLAALAWPIVGTSLAGQTFRGWGTSGNYRQVFVAWQNVNYVIKIGLSRWKWRVYVTSIRDITVASWRPRVLITDCILYNRGTHPRARPNLETSICWQLWPSNYNGQAFRACMTTNLIEHCWQQRLAKGLEIASAVGMVTNTLLPATKLLTALSWCTRSSAYPIWLRSSMNGNHSQRLSDFGHFNRLSITW